MGGDMKELITAGQVERLFVVLAILLPALGLAGGWWRGRRRNAPREGAITGLAIGLLGPLNWVMWRVYNAITDRVCLDTVRNRVINVVLLLAAGALVGIGAGIAIRRTNAARPPAPPADKQE
jgi:drug/metabolite transporter (DMT)-like permease